MMKLYYARLTRAFRPHWLLEEIAAAYELVHMDLKAGDTRKPEYLRIHPHGAVPALVDGDHAIFESSAICMYLADKFPDRRLCPPPGSPLRGRYYQWMVYSVTTLEPPVERVSPPRVRNLDVAALDVVRREAYAKFEEVACVLDRALAGQRFLLGDTFSAADVMIGSLLFPAKEFGLLDPKMLEKCREIERYMDDISTRPAYHAACEVEAHPPR